MITTNRYDKNSINKDWISEDEDVDDENGIKLKKNNKSSHSFNNKSNNHNNAKIKEQNILSNDIDFSLNSCDNGSSFDQHRKQGMTFVNEENIKIKEMRKHSIGNSILNFDSMIRDDRISNTPQSTRILDAQKQKMISQNQIMNKSKNLEIFSNGNINGVDLEIQKQIARQKIIQNNQIAIDLNEVTYIAQLNQNSQLDLNNISKRELINPSHLLGDNINNQERKTLAPTDTQQLIYTNRKSIDTKMQNGGDYQESVIKINSRCDIESYKKNDMACLKSINRHDSNLNTELIQQRGRNGTLVTGGNKAMPSFKFLISIKPKLKRFIQNKTVSGKTKLLNDKIRSYLSDIVDFSKSSKKGNLLVRFISNMISTFEKCFSILGLDRIPLFDPESKLKIIINSIIVTYNCFYILLISVILIFDAHLGHHEHTFTYIAMGSWITEMVVEMNTACYHHNHFITDRKVIIQIYAKEYFFFEILPLIFEGRTSENTLYNVLLHLPLLLKLKGMSIILQKLEFYILQILEKHYIFSLFKLIMQMLLYGHIIACCWNLIVKLETNIIHSITWFDGSAIDNTEWWKRYLIAQYWSFSVMMNVTTKPTTPLELAFTSLIMLLSCIAFGYLLSTVAGIIADLNKQQEDYKRDLNIVNSYMKRKKVDLSVKRRVNINLKTYYQQKSKDNLLVENKALSKLSNEMLYELNCQANSRIIKQFPFFAKLFSEATLTKLYSIMEEEVYAPQQIIFTKNTNAFDQHYLYLILKGEVSIQIEHFVAPNEMDEFELEQQQQIDIEDSIDEEEYEHLKEKKNERCIVRKLKTVEDKAGVKKKMALLKDGQIFGVYSFFTGKDRYIDAQCEEFTTIIKINRQKFQEIVVENKKDYERFCEIRDKLTFNKLVDEIPDQQCMICNSRDHLFDKCHFGHFDKNNILLFFKHNYSHFQERQKKERKDLKMNTLQIISQLSKEINDFRCQIGIEYYTSEDENSQDESGGLKSQSESSPSHFSEGNNKMKKSQKNFSRYHIDEENSKLVYSSFYQQSPSQTKLYPSSDIEIIRPPEEEILKNNRTLSQKHTLGEIDDMSLTEDPQIQRSPSASRRLSQTRQTKPRRSFVKFENQDNKTQNTNSNQNGIVQISSNISINNTNSINTAVRGGGNDQSSNNLGNKRKLSNINLTSPLMLATTDYENGQEMSKRKSFNNQGTNPNFQSYQTNQSIGNNNNNNGNATNNGHTREHPHSTFHQSNQARQMNSEKNLNDQIVDNCAQSVFTKLSNQQQKGNNHFNYRKTITISPQYIIDEHNFIWGFDKQKDFQFYFPYFNQANTIKRFNTYQSKQIRIKRQKLSGKKGTEIILSKKKKQQQSMTNLNSFRVPSLQKINNPNKDSKNPLKGQNDFSLNLVQIDGNRPERVSSNLNIKTDKILQDFLKKQGENEKL